MTTQIITETTASHPHTAVVAQYSNVDMTIFMLESGEVYHATTTTKIPSSEAIVLIEQGRHNELAAQRLPVTATDLDSMEFSTRKTFAYKG